MPRLAGQTALITGAARGIGAAIAEAYVAEGAAVIVTDIDEDRGRATAERIGARFLALDVADPAAWDRIVGAVRQLDILVNNAGITGFEDGIVPHDPEHADLAAWRRVMAVNLDGVFLGCRAALAMMRAKRRGAIVSIASRSGQVGIPGAAAYAASKAGIINHTRTVALYCCEQGLDIRCNAIAPAAILTEMWDPLLGHGPDRDARMAEFVADTPMRRFGTPAEVAAVALLLADPACSYLTGQTITLDGGLLAGSAASPTAPDPAE